MKRWTRIVLLAGGAAAATAAAAAVVERAGILPVGTPAPEISQRAQDGSEFLLSAWRAKSAVVISFYPKDFSAGCTKQLCSYRDRLAEVTALGGILVGVSPDPTASNAAFAGRHRLSFPILSDTDRSVARRYGVLRFGGWLPLNKRVTYVVDREGIIRAAIHRELSTESHIEGILETLAALREEEKGGRGG
jgi:peroxiredoxin Q/BCP